MTIVYAFIGGALFFYLMMFGWTALQYKMPVPKYKAPVPTMKAYKVYGGSMDKRALLSDGSEKIRDVNNVEYMDAFTKEEFIHATSLLPKRVLLKKLEELEMFEQCAWLSERK